MTNGHGVFATTRAVLFDLDGTLYRQPQLRRLMARDLIVHALTSPIGGMRTIRGLREYRHAQETLRGSGIAAGEQQLAVAAERSRMDRAELKQVTAEWMHERPLKYLRRCRADGLLPFLDRLERAEIPAAVFSDYPPGGKLEALELDGRFAFTLCSTDPDVQAFKPDPRGFRVACDRFGLRPDEVLMIGDRAEVDAAGARAAGMPCVIIGTPAASDVLTVPSFERLQRVFDERH